MKVSKEALRLYIVTDRSWLGEKKLENKVEEIINAGATFVQLREKNLSFYDFEQEARKIKEITSRYRIPFVINDNVDVALSVSADGIHIGQNDMSADSVRKIMGNDKILGVSVQTVQQALLAQESGADYIGVGAVFSTSTKNDADIVPFKTLKDICDAVDIPVVAIGGINENNIALLKNSGISGVSVISAVFAKPDAAAATKELLRLTGELFA